MTVSFDQKARNRGGVWQAVGSLMFAKMATRMNPVGAPAILLPLIFNPFRTVTMTADCKVSLINGILIFTNSICQSLIKIKSSCMRGG